MTFPLGQSINTSNLDSSSDDPSQARIDLYNLVVLVNQLVASANSAQGVCVLDSSGLIPNANMNGYFSVLGDVSLRPSSGVINVRNVLRMNQLAAADIGISVGTDEPTAGDIIYLLDGDAGRPCLGVYDGASWRVCRFGTSVGGASAYWTGTEFTLTASAD